MTSATGTSSIRYLRVKPGYLRLMITAPEAYWETRRTVWRGQPRLRMINCQQPSSTFEKRLHAQTAYNKMTDRFDVPRKASCVFEVLTMQSRMF